MTMYQFRKSEMGKHIRDIDGEEALHYLTFQLLHGPIESYVWDVYCSVIPEGMRISQFSYRRFINIVKMDTGRCG